MALAEAPRLLGRDARQRSRDNRQILGASRAGLAGHGRLAKVGGMTVAPAIARSGQKLSSGKLGSSASSANNGR
jgi:hypothetical protein